MKPYLIAILLAVAAIAGIAVEEARLAARGASLAAAEKDKKDADEARVREVKQANASADAWKARYDDLREDRTYQANLVTEARQAAGQVANQASQAIADYKKAVQANAGANRCYSTPAGGDVDALLAR